MARARGALDPMLARSAFTIAAPGALRRSDECQQGKVGPEGQNDLPCFVERFKLYRPKAALRGTLRMETPVLYFHAPRETTVDVSVRFNNGLITEWFPAATVAPAETVGDDTVGKAGFTGTVRWPSVTIQPDGPERYPVQSRSSHYYRARERNAAPIYAGRLRRGRGWRRRAFRKTSGEPGGAHRVAMNAARTIASSTAIASQVVFATLFISAP